MKLRRSVLDLGGYRIHAVHAGAGPTIVLLHGLSGSHHWWRFTIPALADRYSVHAPELVGFGRSRPGSIPTIPEMAEALIEWLGTRGIGRTHLIGHSMGGQLAAHIAARHPERIDRLVLAAATGVPREWNLSQTARLLAELVPPRAWGRIGFWPTILVDAARAGPVTIVSAARALLVDDVRPLLPRIRAPTLLLWGEYDALVPLALGQELARLIPDARMRVLERAAHNLMADRPEDFKGALLSFLNGS